MTLWSNDETVRIVFFSNDQSLTTKLAYFLNITFNSLRLFLSIVGNFRFDLVILGALVTDFELQRGFKIVYFFINL